MEVMPHLKLRDDLGIQYAILPGDPARVERIAEQLEDVEELEFNREYKSIAGTYKGIRMLAVSTGIGGHFDRNCCGRAGAYRRDARDPYRKLRCITKRDQIRGSDLSAGCGER